MRILADTEGAPRTAGMPRTPGNSRNVMAVKDLR